MDRILWVFLDYDVVFIIHNFESFGLDLIDLIILLWTQFRLIVLVHLVLNFAQLLVDSFFEALASLGYAAILLGDDVNDSNAMALWKAMVHFLLFFLFLLFNDLNLLRHNLYLFFLILNLLYRLRRFLDLHIRLHSFIECDQLRLFLHILHVVDNILSHTDFLDFYLMYLAINLLNLLTDIP